MPAALYSEQDSLYSFLLAVRRLQGQSAAEGLGKIRNQMTSLRIEPATFRNVSTVATASPYNSVMPVSCTCDAVDVLVAWSCIQRYVVWSTCFYTDEGLHVAFVSVRMLRSWVVGTLQHRVPTSEATPTSVCCRRDNQRTLDRPGQRWNSPRRSISPRGQFLIAHARLQCRSRCQATAISANRNKP